MRPRRSALLGLALLLVATPEVVAQQGGAQDPGVRPVTRTYAITNARVVQAPGRVLERATVVVHDGLIRAVGPNVRVPVGAQVIEGDSLVVYAGFVDALAHVGLDLPPIDTQARVPNPDDPPRDRAGILPDRLARAHLKPSDNGVEALRKAGFTVAHVAPASGMLSGQSAVVLLAGERPYETVLVPEAALVARFAGGQGVAPATPMAVAARFRQLYREARRQQEARARAEADPTGLPRVPFDPVSTALAPSAAGQQPVFFVASSALEGHRALNLGEELDLRLVLAGVPEPSPLVERLRARRQPVVTPLALPREPRQDANRRETPERQTPEEEPTPETRPEPPAEPPAGPRAGADVDLTAHLGGGIPRTTARTRTYRDVHDEAERLRERQRAAIALHERAPLTLHEAGIPFVFGSMGTSGNDVRAHLRRMVARGLPADEALAALTTRPAELFGLSRRLGTVEPGKLANLVVTDGDYFAEGTRVRYVFVDGERFEVEAARPANDGDRRRNGGEAGAPPAAASVVGTWSYTITVGGDAVGGRLTIRGTPGALAGSIEVPGVGSLPLADVRQEGALLTFTIPGTPLGTARGSARLEGERMEGELALPGQGAAPFTATRRPN